MSIFVGNTLTFQLENVTSTTTEVVLTKQLVRKEFDAEVMEGIGYQRVMLQENYGRSNQHGFGDNADSTALQVTSIPFALPMYRFAFAFVLDSERLKEIMELYLVLYNLRSQGNLVRLRMFDNRLHVSEPVGVNGEFRIATENVTSTENTAVNQTNWGYQLVKTQYLMTWEDFSWEHKVGDFYNVQIAGTEVTVESDNNKGNICQPASEEILLPFTGLNIDEIPIPTNLQQGGDAIECFAITQNVNSFYYMGHFSINGVVYFVKWDEAAPGVTGIQFTDYATKFLAPSIKDSAPINSYATPFNISFLEEDPEATDWNMRVFRDETQPFPLDIFREDTSLPLLYYANLTEVTEYQQQPIEIIDTGIEKIIYIPRKILDPAIGVTSPVNGAVLKERGEWGSTNSAQRATLGEWANQELGRQAFLVGDAQILNDDQAGIPALFNPNRLFNIRLTSGATFNKGAFWFGEKLNLDANTVVRISFELRIRNIIGAADGFALVFHNDFAGTSAIGGSGAKLGFSGWDGVTYNASEAITPSLAFCFDIFGNGTPYLEPASAPPDFFYIALNGKQGVVDATGGTIYLQTLTSAIRDGSSTVVMVFDGPTNTLTVDITPFATAITETLVISPVNLWNGLGQPNSCFWGFTAANGANTSEFHIDRLQINTDSTWRKAPDPDSFASFSGSILSYEQSANTLELRNRTYMGTENLGIYRDIVTVLSRTESNNTYYHLLHDPTDPNIGQVYKTTGPNIFDPSRTLENNVIDGSIPVVELGIASPVNEFKFYFTQGAASGNVYVTTDFVTFTVVGSWDSKTISNPVWQGNQGQLYTFRNRYIFRSPSRFVIDAVTDTLIDVETLLCPAEIGTSEYNDIFGAGREFVVCYPTPAHLTTEYQTAGEEKIIIGTRDTGTEQNFKLFKLQPVDIC